MFVRVVERNAFPPGEGVAFRPPYKHHLITQLIKADSYSAPTSARPFEMQKTVHSTGECTAFSFYSTLRCVRSAW